MTRRFESGRAPRRVALLQDGARLHYAVPAALHRAGLLERMFTDWFVRPGTLETRLARLVSPWHATLAGAMAGRWCSDLEGARIDTNPLLTCRSRLGRRRFGLDVDYYRWVAERVARRVLRRGFGDAEAIMGYVRNIHPELLEAARHLGLMPVADQIIAPAAVELAEAQHRRQRWPGFDAEQHDVELMAYARWEQQTWPLLDRITCGSDYVKAGLVAQGLDAERISVLPYPIDADAVPVPDRADRRGTLTVGFVGAVSARKGAPCFFEVARRFARQRVRFVMVGESALDTDVLAAARGTVELTGKVARGAVPSHLAQFDLFFFPSTCEGSAGAVMEALAAGLPVVTSPQSGSVVRDGIEGFVCPCDDVDQYAERIGQLVADAELRHDMGRAARHRAEQFNLDWYSRELAGVFQGSRAAEQPAASA